MHRAESFTGRMTPDAADRHGECCRQVRRSLVSAACHQPDHRERSHPSIRTPADRAWCDGPRAEFDDDDRWVRTQDQFRNRSQTVFQGPHRSGRSRQAAPVDSFHKIPPDACRRSRPGPPVRPGDGDGDGDGDGATNAHGPAVSSCLRTTNGPPSQRLSAHDSGSGLQHIDKNPNTRRLRPDDSSAHKRVTRRKPRPPHNPPIEAPPPTNSRRILLGNAVTIIPERRPPPAPEAEICHSADRPDDPSGE